MDIVDIAAVRGDIGAAEALRRRNALAERFVLCFPFRPMRCKFRSESRRIGIEDHAVDRLKIERRLMDVLDLHEREAGGIGLPLVFRQSFALFLPEPLGRGERVVAVADGKGELAVFRCVTVFFPLQCRIIERVERRLHRRFRLPAHAPAGDVAAAEHKIKIVDLFQCVLRLFREGQDTVCPVVHQKERMRHFERRAAADVHARRQTLLYRALRGADARTLRSGKIVLLKIKRRNEAAADASVRQCALYIDKAVRDRLKNALREIAAHRIGNASVRAVGARGVQPRLRQHKRKRARLFRRTRFRRGPVFRFGRKLVARDHAPRAHILGAREKDIRTCNDMHR